MATGSYMTPIYSRSQSEVLGDLHNSYYPCFLEQNTSWKYPRNLESPRVRQRFQDDGNVSRCYSTGRPRVTKPSEDCYRYDNFTSQTVYRRLGHIGLYARRPVSCVPLNPTHCRLRLTWSREHALWTPQQWFCVMFSLRRV
ncbi:HTH_Tnp_Tc3_2 domain-containing protein, partial [Trichonephila clavipes]